VAGKRGANTVAARPADGPAFLSKAREYLEAAEDAIGRENFTAAVGNAVRPLPLGPYGQPHRRSTPPLE
jgi:hypothetical protein